MAERFLPCRILQPVTSLERGYLKDNHFDTVCVIDGTQVPVELEACFSTHRAVDDAFDSEICCFKSDVIDCRVVYAPVGKLTDFDDVRRYAEVAGNALNRAIKAGAKQPLLILPSSKDFLEADLVAVLGALAKLYVPLQLREDVPAKKQRFAQIGFFHTDASKLAKIIKEAKAFESGRHVARDIGGGDPERMAPPRVDSYLDESVLDRNLITKTVISDEAILLKNYPLFAAVNRAAAVVPRHQGRLIFLEYTSNSPPKKTLILVGKGVTYDTGGADIKAGGVMAGMSRDKCGAAAVAGFMKVVEQMQPQGVHVIGVLCMVRNSVGEECYVSDEMITSRAGVRVRVGNTDAEGRMAMADALCHMKERIIAENMPDAHLFTIATLTGHAVLAVGNSSIVMDNGPARAAGHGLRLQEQGEKIGDPFEISILRKEDFDFHCGKCYGEDVLQANNLPSSRTVRGHQSPAAFMILSTGLDKHGLKSDRPIKYSHLDIAGSAGDIPDPPTGAPILALARTHLH
ncbi:putative aminopeptidase W07G4.4 [Toxorhynchites rutilus septentrionalis]|uniref:putative aminopeptidase W07G4.4 n=1 Tax=Toxorhynchites rutilus septentrionalis TaxID=329112 RepID=UPI0024799F84|nr:putative aminopeptidase W07G4.4 [Toxorhynchites rutilus septentrionalis]XP_055633224.1 putative aminopeptidase W07G4.4 [Toxorhynchites rutilus septentrionalis]XP_055633230.1 putative aminopeptidase W07G4.4 [Toxorhynchites rutilus septentrionalis]